MKHYTIDSIIKEMIKTADVLDANHLITRARVHRQYAEELTEAWKYAVQHPEEWCDCDKCVSNNDHDNVTLKAALLRIINYINKDDDMTDDERLSAVEKIAKCALERYKMHSISNDTTTSKVVTETKDGVAR